MAVFHGNTSQPAAAAAPEPSTIRIDHIVAACLLAVSKQHQAALLQLQLLAHLPIVWMIPQLPV